ncbi:MAG: phosphatidylserine decarboxylase [Gammaproteobacteria bacterium]
MIARHGVAPLLAVILAAVAVMHFLGWLYSLPVWLLASLLLFLYRDPQRNVPSRPLSVVSPADGRVASVSHTPDPYLGRASLKISIEMNPLGVFTARSPVEGKVLEPRGQNAQDDQPHGVWLQTDEGDDIVMVMNRGRLKNKPRCYIGFGERVGQGRRCGFVHWGGRIDIYLPDYSRAEVEEDARVLGGSDVIASLVHD